MNFYKTKNLTLLLVMSLAILSCGGNSEKQEIEKDDAKVANEVDPNDWRTNKGIGPITKVSLSEEVSDELANTGKAVFELKCSACHKTDKRYIGPPPQNILERRTPEWVMNMILNPGGMVAEDPIAKQLLVEYNGTPMANQNLTEEEARAILEYFRTL